MHIVLYCVIYWRCHAHAGSRPTSRRVLLHFRFYSLSGVLRLTPLSPVRRISVSFHYNNYLSLVTCLSGPEYSQIPYSHFTLYIASGKNASIFLPLTMPNADRIPKFFQWQTSGAYQGGIKGFILPNCHALYLKGTGQRCCGMSPGTIHRVTNNRATNHRGDY